MLIQGEFVGYAQNSKIQNCYNIGNVNAKGFTVGGIIGFQIVGGDIINCYNVGNITGPSIIGGIVGANGNSPTYYGGTISNCYFINTNALGNGFIYEYNNGQNNYYSKTSDEMKEIATDLGGDYIYDGKKIDKNGNIVENKDKDGNIIYINNGYPILIWQLENK